MTAVSKHLDQTSLRYFIEHSDIRIKKLDAEDAAKVAAIKTAKGKGGGNKSKQAKEEHAFEEVIMSD